MAARQAPLYLGFSRQELWSGLHIPSPMHESEKWKWSHAVLSDSSRPHGLQLVFYKNIKHVIKQEIVTHGQEKIVETLGSPDLNLSKISVQLF